jgi:hypothetical protein
VQLISMLLDAGDVKGAAEEWTRVGEGYPSTEIRLASRSGSLAAVLERYRLQPEKAPDAQTLREAATQLRQAHDENGARTVLEFVYDREIREGRLEAANFLGLAEVKLQRGDAGAAAALLNRMTLVVEDGFETLMPAAELLGRYGQTTAAADFVRRRLKAVPWDAQARLQTGDHASVIGDSQVEYRLRAEAARMAGISWKADADKPYHVEARIEAAQTAADPETKLRLWRQALAIAPGDERARLGALEAAIAQRRDSLALALEQTEIKQLTPAKRASIAEALAAAAERLDELKVAQSHLQLAIDLLPPGERAGLVRRRDALAAEQERRAKNAARQPAIRNVVEQDQIVRPRMNRRSQ